MADTRLTHDLWLERVPELLDECVEEWSLRLGEPYPLGAAGYAVRAELDDGTPGVLKLIYPHREAEHEAATLRVWDGDGAIRLLDIDPKPLLGERELGVAPIVRDYVLGHSRGEVLRRLEHLRSQLDLDRERALGWTVGQTVAWMFESTHLRTHLDTVRWLLEARR